MFRAIVAMIVDRGGSGQRALYASLKLFHLDRLPRKLYQPQTVGMGLILLALAHPSPTATATTDQTNAGISPAQIELFFEAGCQNCEYVDNEILPELEGLYGDFYRLDRFDIGIASNYLRLAGYQEQMHRTDDEDVSMVVNGQVMLSGLTEIRGRLFETMDRALGGDLVPVTAAPATLDTLQARVRQFTLPGVIAAGLVDGLNPCAIATLVFFMSLLAVLKFSGRQLLLAGSAFCAGSFITYFAIGLGLLRVLHLAAGFETVRAAIDLGMTLLLILFAALSFRDAWRFRHDGDPNQLSLRLPRPIMLLTHALMRRGLQSRHLVLVGLGIGAAVTALETVCTGQVYVPTLVMVMRGGSSFMRAAVFLALYNVLFVLPLVVILWLTWRGLKTETLLAWSRRNVVFSKCLLGCLFLGLAVLLILL